MRRLFAAALVLLALGGVARADDDAERWDLVRSAVFNNRPAQDAAGAVEIKVPDRAVDAALVPVTVTMDPAAKIVALSLFVDNNPSPLVGTFHFGPAMAIGQLKTRVRVDNFTFIHAVAETSDGKLLVASHYIKAAGGCSAPVTGASAEIAARIGQIQLRRTRPAEGNVLASQLLISHPNYNGMQMGNDNATIPARYLETISVTTGGVTVFNLESSISLSEDPSISFSYVPAGDGAVVVVAKDSTGAVFTRHYEPLAN